MWIDEMKPTKPDEERYMFGFRGRHDRHEMHEGCARGGREERGWFEGRERMQRDDGSSGERGGHRGHGRHGHERGERGGPMGGRGGRGGGGPMGRGRFFDHGDLKLLILALVAEKPSHGYEIIKAIEERVAGAYSPSPGVVYPTLTMLEELGLVTVETIAGNRKQHQITEEGRAYLAANETEVKVIFARMAEAGEQGRGGRSPQLIRAMENLRLALRLRFASGTPDADQIATITAALDEAAGKIERS